MRRFQAFVRRMSMQIPSQLSKKFLPPTKYGMKELDKSFFEKKIPLVAVVFPDSRNFQDFMKKYRHELLNLRKNSNIVVQNNQKVILLKDSIDAVDKVYEQIEDESMKQFLKKNNADFRPYELKLDYGFWRSDEILEAILPPELHKEIPSGFTAVGHIAHININAEYLPYKHLIGQIILDKNANVSTVVNKLDTIETKFRTFSMEVIAGEPKFDVEQIESGCKFNFNFKEVYWNSRLQGEHLRLINIFKPGELVFDVMAGVGPFAVPAGKKKVSVVANDLNPASYKYLVQNSQQNKTDQFVDCYNIDGAEMIRDCTKYLMKYYESRNGVIEVKKTVRSKDKQKRSVAVEKNPVPKQITHFVMNLPDSALTFLNNFRGIFNNESYFDFLGDEELRMPMIHVYCFEKFAPTEIPPPSDKELESRVLKRMEDIMGISLEGTDVSFHLVRKVAPTKIMFCVSFQLPKEYARA